MCADAKTLSVDRGERLGSLGAAAVSVRASLRECCSTQRAKSRRGQKKRKKERGLQKVKKTLMKELRYHWVTVKNQCM